MDRTFLKATLVLLTAGLSHGVNVLPAGPLSASVAGAVNFTTTIDPPAEPFLIVKWYVNGSTIISSAAGGNDIGPGYENRVTLYRSTGSLELRNLTLNDDGVYTVSLFTSGADELNGETTLNVYPVVPTPILTCPTNNLVEKDHSMNLTCDADSSVTNRVWRKNGGPVVSGNGIHFYEGNRVLSISPVRRTDTGDYLCNVSNPASFRTARCNLVVYYGPDNPTIIQEPTTATLAEKLTLTCSADSLPKAKFSWTFNHVVTEGPVLTIRELEDEHLGEYTCTAHNVVTGATFSRVHTLTGSAVPVSGSVFLMGTITLLSFMLV